MTWTTAEVLGHPVELYAPVAPDVEMKADAALLFLPNAGQRASDSTALTAALEQIRLPAIAPLSANCWWLNRVEPSFDDRFSPIDFLVEQLVPLFAERWNIAPPAIRLLGHGTGGQGVFQLAFRDPRNFPAVAAVDPALDFHDVLGRGSTLDGLYADREAARQETATVRMHPAAWPRRQMLIADRGSFWFDGADRLAMKLHSMNLPVTTEFHDLSDSAASQFFESVVASAVKFLSGNEPIPLPVIKRDK